jgi:nitrogenase molybdenum-iron protein alpha/beta subunit
MKASLLAVERLPWTNGVLLAANAIPRLAAIIDGPYCVAHKAEGLLAHDMFSDLLGIGAPSRALFTLRRERIEEVAQMALDRVPAVEAVFDEGLSPADRDGAICTSFDLPQLVEFPLAAIAKRAQERHGKPVIHVPSQSLAGDWIGGYGATCHAIAAKLPLPPRERAPDSVALVGYLFDRAEADHDANLAELRRLLEALGLAVSTVWLSGRRLDDLARVAEAEVIVSLPYAGRAATTLAARTGARLVESGLPLGLEATARFVITVAEAFGRQRQAEAFVERELDAAVSATLTHVRRFVAGRGARLCRNDPFLEEALRGFCREAGLEVLSSDGYYGTKQTELERARDDGTTPEQGVVVFSDPLPSEPARNVAFVPVGFPSCRYHPLVPRPYLGFSGFRHLVDRIAGEVLRSA